MKKIIISYDYELFFGDKSGTITKSLIEPTKLILDYMDLIGAKGNFFIDYLMFERLESQDDERSNSDLMQIREQVKDIVRRGHRIELHLHPHWIDAKYNGDGTWDFSSFEHYSLYSLDNLQCARMFKAGTEYLNKIAREVDPDYSICAFRAGGWTIQPFVLIKDFFKGNGIRVDSSVMYGAFQEHKFSKYDFRGAPNKAYYCFSDDVCVESENGEFWEIPISTYKLNFFNLLLQGLSNRLHLTRRLTDGTHSRAEEAKTVKPGIKERFRIGYQSFSFSQVNPLNIVFSSYKNKSELFCYIDHPKDYSKLTLINIKMACKFGSTITYKEFIDTH